MTKVMQMLKPSTTWEDREGSSGTFQGRNKNPRDHAETGSDDPEGAVK